MTTNFYMLKNLVTFFAISLCFNMSAQTWEDITTPVTTNLILFDISFPQGQNDVGYTGGATSTWNAKGKILKTTNQGADWEVIYESDVSGTGVTAILFFDVDNGFAGTQAGNLMKTTDGGVNWTSTDFDTNFGQGEVTAINFFDDDNGVILTAWGGVYVTADKGVTWTQATTNVPGVANEIEYADANNLFAVGNQQKIYKSGDGGHNWSEIFQGPSGWMINTGVNFLNSNTGLVTSEDGNLFITSDGGDTWTSQVVAGQGGLMRGTLIADENTMYITATPGAVFKSVDGGVNWTLDSPVDGQPSYYKIIMTDNGSLFVSGSGSDGGTILRKIALAPVTSTSTTQDLLCNGDDSGAISLDVIGGVMPYTFTWSNGAMTQNISNLPAGTYSCTITDDSGASIEVADLMVNEPSEIAVSATVIDETLITYMDGSIDIDVSGGTAPFTFLWNTGATTEDIENLEGGEYCVTITDSNNCQFETCETVMEGAIATHDIINLTSFELFPNPVNEGEELILNVQFSTPTNIQIAIINSVGQEIYSNEKNKIESVKMPLNIEYLVEGFYFIKIKDLDSHNFNSKKLIKVN